MTYEEFEEKAGKSLEKAYDEVTTMLSEKDPEMEDIGKQLKENLLLTIVPLNNISLLGKLIFDKLGFSDEELITALKENYETYKANLIEQFKSDNLL